MTYKNGVQIVTGHLTGPRSVELDEDVSLTDAPVEVSVPAHEPSSSKPIERLSDFMRSLPIRGTPADQLMRDLREERDSWGERLMRLCLDSSAIIFGIEGDETRRARVLDWIANAENSPDSVLMTSALCFVECRVKATRSKNDVLLAAYDRFLSNDRLQILEISRPILDRALPLRAEHRFKTPDAIHLATALIHGADVFLTGDKELAKCPGIRVEIVPS